MSVSVTKTLTDLGLEPISADMYMLMVEKGAHRPKEIATTLNVSLSSVHNSLRELTDHDLITWRKKGRAVFYRAAHPRALARLMDERRKEMQLLDGKIGQAVDVLSKLYSSTGAQPGLTYAEGEDAVIDLMASMQAEAEDGAILNICSWVPNANSSMTKRLEKLAIARTGRRVKKKLLIPNTPEVIAFEKSLPPDHEYTEIRVYDPEKYHFPGVVEVKRDKVLYTDATGATPISFLIENAAIATNHKTLFEMLWSAAKPLQ